MKTGILLFAHGARDPRWADPFREVEREVRQLAPQAAVALAFLEFMPPTLREAGARLVEDGCTSVAVVPLFLGAGGHVRKDVPELLGQLRAAHPQVAWSLCRAVGEHPEVVRALAHAAVERTWGGAGPANSEMT
ncbi:sirohydrochlorin chelatase [Caldimonas aquatica]|uniref:CbiX/SirB N-terminal domain-containing protein n=1 Tax=Caldimonas aquatica TaxID=376175 RepID=A0ABY6MWC2_9BURK|nr:CbiX/SirB N-terminal domain-containing protein [Schlegelella aquatica]UZD56297.1 CbiX/SirB N-terminal domain-containing protein [Schlegelella aquatica]